MGVDIGKARRRQPGVFRRLYTNETGLAQFLQEKGTSLEVIASIVSRFPRSITRSLDHLEQRWQLWRNVFSTDAEIVSILERSPESFFRSSDNENLQKNVAFLMSLKLNSKDFHRLITKAPRTFSNSIALNKQKVELLEDICLQLGGKNPEQFAKTIITKNVYVLIMSDKRIRSNIDTMKDFLKMSDSAFLDLLEGRVANILDLSNESLKKNLKNLEQKLSLLGCDNDEIKKLITKHPVVLGFGPRTLNAKLDCLLSRGITIKQILEKPKVLNFRAQNTAQRLEQLQKVGYDFEKYGIHILDSSQQRFIAKMKKFSALK